MNTKRQAGSVIVICLMFLMGLSLIAVSAMKVGNLNMKIIQNEIAKERMRYKEMQALEQVLSVDANIGVGAQIITVDGKTIELEKNCLYALQAEGYGVNAGSVVPENTVWEITATDTDNGVRLGLLQGIRMHTLKGRCSL